MKDEAQKTLAKLIDILDMMQDDGDLDISNSELNSLISIENKLKQTT